jgi:SAM-dependent methyltransferase
MYSESCSLYDAIYRAKGKDYQKETNLLLSYIERFRPFPDDSLLDVACGTGMHLRYLSEAFTLEGIDVSPQMVAIARKANPGITIHQMNMVDFNLRKRFGVVCCLFSSIGFVRTEMNLHKAIACMTRHLARKGILVVEPWLFPESIRSGQLHAAFVDEPEIKVARMSAVKIQGRKWNETDHFLVMTKRGVRHFTEELRMGIFDRGQYEDAMEKNGLEVAFEKEGLTGRGLFIGVKKD